MTDTVAVWKVETELVKRNLNYKYSSDIDNAGVKGLSEIMVVYTGYDIGLQIIIIQRVGISGRCHLYK